MPEVGVGLHVDAATRPWPVAWAETGDYFSEPTPLTARRERADRFCFCA